METTDQLYQCRLPSPRLAYQSHCLTRFNVQVNVLQDGGWVVGIVEIYMLKAYFSADGGQLNGFWSILNFDLGIHQPKNALTTCHSRLEGIVPPAQVTDWLEKTTDVKNKGHQHTWCNLCPQ